MIELRRAREAVQRSLGWLQTYQNEDGGWDGMISSETVITSWLTYGLILAGQADSDMVRRSISWLLANQNPDGSWGGSIGQPGYPEATLFACGVLKVAGVSEHEKALVHASQYLAGHEKCAALMTQLFLAMESGDASKVSLPMPAPAFRLILRVPKLLRLIKRVPRYVHEIIFAAGLIYLATSTRKNGRVHKKLTRTLEAMWDRNGRWVIAGPVMAAMARYGANTSPKTMQQVIEWARAGQNPDGGWSWAPHGQFLDTTLPTIAMGKAGVHPDDQMMQNAMEWVLLNRTPEYMWGTYRAMVPDADDTSSAILALLACGVPKESPLIRDAVRFLKANQRTNGSWGYPDGQFECNHAEETGIAVYALLESGEQRTSPAVRKGVTWLVNHQMPDGSWPARWYTQRTAPVFRAVLAMRAAGYAPDSSVLVRAAHFLRSRQTSTGSFGGIDDTAYATSALLALSGPKDDAVQRGIAWLLGAQDPNGSWLPEFNGYFADPFGSWVFNYRDRMWTASHCLWAIGDYVQCLPR